MHLLPSIFLPLKPLGLGLPKLPLSYLFIVRLLGGWEEVASFLGRVFAVALFSSVVYFEVAFLQGLVFHLLFKCVPDYRQLFICKMRTFLIIPRCTCVRGPNTLFG